MSSITEFNMAKGLTSGSEKTNVWRKKSLRLKVKLPETISEQDFQAALTRAEYIIDNWLGEPEATQIPEFDPQLLINHAWKGKKQSDGSYAKGSCAWGWDFTDQFPKDLIQVLEKGPVTIDKYEFGVTETGAIVQAKEKKEGRKRRS
jgi:hypothetical protein